MNQSPAGAPPGAPSSQPAIPASAWSRLADDLHKNPRKYINLQIF